MARESFTYESIRRLAGDDAYVRGIEMYLRGQVGTVSARHVNFYERRLKGTVTDGAVYTVQAALRPHDDETDYMLCSCCGCTGGRLCAHAVALAVKYIDTELGIPLQDGGTIRLLKSYDAEQPRRESAPVTLTPLLSMEGGAPSAAFKIGRERGYIIKGVLTFAENMRRGIPQRYGDKFSFSHDIDAFDERSRRICVMIMRYADGMKALIGSKRWSIQETFGDVRDMPLSGESFDLLFELYKGERLPRREGSFWTLTDRDPTLELNAKGTAGRLILTGGSTGYSLYETGAHHYAYDENTIYRLTESFARDTSGLLSSGINGKGLVLSGAEAKRFCMTVLPRVYGYLDGDASYGLQELKPFMPEELEVRYLLDMPERGRLTAQPNFTYGESYVEPGSGEEMYPDIRRNFIQEKQALKALEEYFEPPRAGDIVYTLTDENRMFDLLTSGTEKLAKYGGVFVSNRLKSLTSRRAPRPTVRAGVSNGMLELKLDTDEFPREELEALMRCVREKRRYYRLKDGSFLDIADGRFSDFTRTLDSLNIDVRSMAEKGAVVPLYKALFTDEALRSDRGVQLEKDAEYKRLLRDFKTVEDGDFPVPEPLDKVLREYQKTGYMWLRTIDKYAFGGILADDMGLGKTLQVLALLLAIRREGAAGPALIVCPASVIISWGDEIQKWTPDLKSCLLAGGASERALTIKKAEEFDILVTSYDSFRNDAELHAENYYRVCVLDEAQYIKNRDTKINRCVRRIRARTRLALTGTPIENRLSELWSIFEFLMPGYLGSYAAFREKYESPIAENEDKTAKSTLSKLVRPFILRRMKTDVLSELPPKTETNCYIQMDSEQRRLYLAYANEVRQRMESSAPQDKLLILSMLTRLRQICCDPALVYEGYEDASCKTDECVRMVQELIENGHRVLLFSQFTTMLSRLEARLSALGIASFTLRGDTPLDERARLVKAFNAGQGSVFLISLKAGGTGLNLIGADTVIHYDPWWNIAAQNQATDRCYRIGQMRAVQVYKLIASDTIEENIVRLQYKKLELASVVSENADGSLMNMTKEELMELLR